MSVGEPLESGIRTERMCTVPTGRMLDGDALAEHDAPRRGLLQLAELVLLRVKPGNGRTRSGTARDW